MQTKLVLTSALALSLLAPAVFAAGRITPAQAKAAAVHKIPGKAQSAKYEFEDGRWQYAVLVQKGSALYEVEVNAQTGVVTDTEKTSAAEERSEAAADAKAAAKKMAH